MRTGGQYEGEEKEGRQDLDVRNGCRRLYEGGYVVAGTDSVLGYDGCYDSGTSPHGYCTREQQVWQQVISRAVERGEVQPNIDMQLMAQTFIALFYGRAYRDSLTNGLDADLLKRQMLQLYEAIAHK